MSDVTVTTSRCSTVGLLFSRGISTLAESIGIGYAMAIGPTLYERSTPMVGHIRALGFEEGWAEGIKEGWVAPASGMIGSGIAGRLTVNLVAGGMEMIYGRKLQSSEKIICEAMGAFVAVGLQVGAFSGAGLGALLSPPGLAALATYAAASAITQVVSFIATKPLKSLANYSRKVFASNPDPAPAMA